MFPEDFIFRAKLNVDFERYQADKNKDKERKKMQRKGQALSPSEVARQKKLNCERVKKYRQRQKEEKAKNSSQDQDVSQVYKTPQGRNSTSSADEDNSSEEEGDRFSNVTRDSHYTYKEVSSESSEEDSESHAEEGGSSEEDGLTRNKGSGGPDTKERTSHVNKSSSDAEEMPEKKDIQAQQGLPDKLLSLFKGCTLFSLPYHLDRQINAVSDG